MSFRLQDEFGHLEEEIKRTVEESKIVQEKYKTMYEQARRELGEKSAQLEEIRTSVSLFHFLFLCLRFDDYYKVDIKF